MILLPVIERELRAVARQGFTYYLRIISVLALLLVFGDFVLEGNIGPGIGAPLFGSMHRGLF